VGRRGGALTTGPVAASRRQGLGLEHHGPATNALGKGSRGGAHRCGGAMAGRSGGSVRRRPHRREGGRRLRLATGEDERGEGGSKTGNGGGLVGLTVGGRWRWWWSEIRWGGPRWLGRRR
jgi:hypothetical protein